MLPGVLSFWRFLGEPRMSAIYFEIEERIIFTDMSFRASTRLLKCLNEQSCFSLKGFVVGPWFKRVNSKKLSMVHSFSQDLPSFQNADFLHVTD